MSGFNVPMSPLSSSFGGKTAKNQWVKKRVAVFGDGTGRDNDAQASEKWRLSHAYAVDCMVMLLVKRLVCEMSCCTK